MLNPQDRARLQSDAFSRNLHDALGGASVQALDLKTQLDVAQMEIGVLNDQLKAEKEVSEKAQAQALAYQKNIEELQAQVAALQTPKRPRR